MPFMNLWVCNFVSPGGLLEGFGGFALIALQNGASLFLILLSGWLWLLRSFMDFGLRFHAWLCNFGLVGALIVCFPFSLFLDLSLAFACSLCLFSRTSFVWSVFVLVSVCCFSCLILPFFYFFLMFAPLRRLLWEVFSSKNAMSIFQSWPLNITFETSSFKPQSSNIEHQKKLNRELPNRRSQIESHKLSIELWIREWTQKSKCEDRNTWTRISDHRSAKKLEWKR